MTTRTPAGLAAGGRKLWRDIADAVDLDAAQQVTLLEVCRAKDRLDRLDDILRGDTDTWARLTLRATQADYVIKIDAALSQANSTANMMKQLLAALRLPDNVTGKRPQQRGGARGVYSKPVADVAKPVAKVSKVSSLDAARLRSSGA